MFSLYSKIYPDALFESGDQNLGFEEIVCIIGFFGNKRKCIKKDNKLDEYDNNLKNKDLYFKKGLNIINSKLKKTQRCNKKDYQII